MYEDWDWVGAASGQPLREASEKGQELGRGGSSDCKGPGVGRRPQVPSRGAGGRGGDGQLAPTGGLEYAAEIDQNPLGLPWAEARGNREAGPWGVGRQSLGEGDREWGEKLQILGATWRTSF